MEEKHKRTLKAFVEDGIFLKPEHFKDKEKEKIIYLTKNVTEFDQKALEYVRKKKREKELRLRPSKDTMQEEQ